MVEEKKPNWSSFYLKTKIAGNQEGNLGRGNLTRIGSKGEIAF